MLRIQLTAKLVPEVAEWSWKIKCFFSYFQDNYWLCNNTTWRERSSLDLDSNEDWIKFVADLDGGGEQGWNLRRMHRARLKGSLQVG